MLGETMRINRKAEHSFFSIKLFYLTVRPGWMEKSSPRTIISFFFSVARQTSCILDKAVNALNRMKTEKKKKVSWQNFSVTVVLLHLKGKQVSDFSISSGKVQLEPLLSSHLC